MDDLQETVRESLNKLPKDVVVLLRSKNLLRSLVQRMVIDQACAAVQLPAEKLDQAIASFCEQHGLTDEESLERYLSHQGLIKPDLIHQLGIPLKVQYLGMSLTANIKLRSVSYLQLLLGQFQSKTDSLRQL